jgi:hypothetical protein
MTDHVQDPAEIRERLEATGQAKPGGGFEILAITAGNGNGWKFSADVLQESLQLWDGAETFVDHSWSFFGARSVRDLGGVCSAPAWDSEKQGIKLQLKPLGPSGPLVEALGQELLAVEGEKPRVGFSADVVFTSKGKDVKKILRVLSLDLVFNPARGGAFVRALNSLGIMPPGGLTMAENTPNPGDIPQESQLNAELEAAQAIVQQHQEQTRLAEEAQAAH